MLLGHSLRPQVGQGRAGFSHSITRHSRLCHATGIQPGQLQQLGHQPSGAVAALQHSVQRVLALAARVGATGHLRLHANGRNRRSQFMRGIGCEAAFTVHLLRHLIKQSIERPHQRLHLCRNHLAQRLTGIGVTLRDRLTQLAQSAQRLKNGAPDQQSQHR